MAGRSLRAPRPGTALKRTGVALIAAGMIFNFSAQVLNTFPWWQVFLSAQADIVFDIYEYTVLSAVVLIPGGAFLIWRGRQYAAQASAKRIVSDSKPHLLYLRAFRSDTSTAKEVFNAFDYLNNVLGFQSEEEQLVEVLQPFGELITIGRPGESLPTPGAARIYTSDEEWKEVVKRRIQAAQLVVIRAAAGENVFWELTQAVNILNPQKLLILVLEMKVRDYDSFRMRANSILDAPLPESTRLRSYGRISGFIGFAMGWKPSFFALRGPLFNRGSFKRRCKYALKPVFESFGLEWQAPPASGQVLKMLFALLIALWPLLWVLPRLLLRSSH
jgi:hypothetical protein